MTKPPEPVVTGELKVTQSDRDAAADLIEEYWQGAGEAHDQMRKTAASYRAGHSQGVWAVAFARHRTANALPGDVGMREALEDIISTYERNAVKENDEWEEGYEDALAECARKARAALTPSALSGDAGEGE